MRKFLGKRGFAVFTSLALCASLVAPSFAATFADLQSVIDSNEDVTEGEILREGNKITLNGKVERTDTDKQPITIGGSHGNITLDLNGQTIDGTGGNGKASFLLQGGTLTIEDSTGGGEVKGGNSNGVVNMTGASNLTLNSGTISGNENGTGVKVNSGASFTMNGGTISGNANSGVTVNGGTFTMDGGTISGNSIALGGAGGGGVYVTNGSFTMNDGVITGNKAELGSGGGVGVKGENSSFTMNGGEISNNTVGNNGGEGGGGGVWVKDKANFTMNDGKITENKVEKNGGNGGGVAIHQANFTMNGGEISGNESSRGIGVLVNAGSNYGGDASFTMTGGYVKGQDGKSCIYLEEGSGKNAVFNLSGDAVMDGSIYLGSGTQVITNNVTQPNGVHVFTDFGATDTDGGNATTIDKSETETDNGYQANGNTLLHIHYSHVWNKEEWVSDGPNTHSHRCQYCSEMQPGSAVGHRWNDGEVTTEATAETAGVKTFICQDCGEIKTETIAPTGYTWDDGKVTTEPTCTTEGVKTYTSTNSNKTYTESIPANGHKWDDGVVTLEPTCVTAGMTTYTCSVCKATKTETIAIDPGNHVVNGVDGRPEDFSKFDKDGVEDADRHHKYCAHCGVELDSGAHKWNSVVTAEPTTEAEGERTYTCTDCGATYTESIDRLPVGGDTIIGDPDVPLGGLPDEIEIEEPDVPLAGLFTRADAIGYLWEQAGSPDAALSDFPDVPAGHEWAVAIGWAQDVGIAVADLDGNFRPDDLLERSVEDIELKPEGEFEQFLNRYAEFAGIELEPDELFIELFGEPDEIIMGEDAQVIFDSFFDRLELALAQAA